MKTAIVIGSTGLTGKYLVQELIKNSAYQKIILLLRKKQNLNHPKVIEIIVDFDKLTEFQNEIKGDDLFCTIGTTIKKAGSKEAFTKVDLDYMIATAKIAQQNGVKKMMYMSALGADALSTNFYFKTKGACEKSLMDLYFESLFIFRPSMLTGNRAEFRFGEIVGAVFLKLFSFLLVGKFKKYRAIKASNVAIAMVLAAQTEDRGVRIFESDEIEGLNK